MATAFSGVREADARKKNKLIHARGYTTTHFPPASRQKRKKKTPADIKNGEEPVNSFHSSDTFEEVQSRAIHQAGP